MVGKEKKDSRKDWDPEIPIEGMPLVVKTSHNAPLLKSFYHLGECQTESRLLTHGPVGDI